MGHDEERGVFWGRLSSFINVGSLPPHLYLPHLTNKIILSTHTPHSLLLLQTLRLRAPPPPPLSLFAPSLDIQASPLAAQPHDLETVFLARRASLGFELVCGGEEEERRAGDVCASEGDGECVDYGEGEGVGAEEWERRGRGGGGELLFHDLCVFR